MSRPVHHIIQKQSLSIEFKNPASGLGLQNRMAELFYEQVQPRMSVLFDEMANEEHVIEIDTLEIDCGIISGKSWEKEWADAVLFQLKEKIKGLPMKTRRNSFSEQFFHFLEFGLSQWNSSKTISQLEDQVVADKIFIKNLKEVLQNSQAARKRLTNQFSEKFLQRLVNAYLEDRHEITGANLKNEHLPLLQKHSEKDSILKLLLDNTQIEQVLKKETNDPLKKSIAEKRAEAKTSKGIYVRNAGLVLLHPFLPTLFEELNLTIDNVWRYEEAHQKALLISEFLVTGEETFPEFNLPLNKILCDFDLGQTSDLRLKVDVEIKTACEELLTAVIKHWSVLKNTGIESLRETFLQRNGKLTQVDKGWLLQVEQKGVDVLLNKLPWGLGIIKLPWMKEFLYVEWT